MAGIQKTQVQIPSQFMYLYTKPTGFTPLPNAGLKHTPANLTMNECGQRRHGSGQAEPDGKGQLSTLTLTNTSALLHNWMRHVLPWHMHLR